MGREPLHLRYKTPGTLMIFGEYFITLEHHRALCMAVDIYATLDITYQEAPSSVDDNFSLISEYAQERIAWDSALAYPLYTEAVSQYAHYCSEFKSNVSPIHIQSATVSTKDFFSADGTQKLGLGSSEASALLSCVLVLITRGKDPLSNTLALADYASRTHFIWQGYRGSGYGIHTSLFGGVGFYHKYSPKAVYVADAPATGDYSGTWHPLPLPDAHWYYVKGTANVSSSDAIKKFQERYLAKDTALRTLEERFKEHLDIFPSIDSPTALCEWLKIAKNLGIALGNIIGVNAVLQKELPNINVLHISQAFKCTGAGNENAIIVSEKALAQDSELIKIHPARGLELVAESKDLKVSACGKLLLFGEFLALFGHSAVGIPIPQCMHAYYSDGCAPPSRITEDKELSSLRIDSTHPISDDFLLHIADVSQEFGMPPLTGIIKIKSDIPIGAGLGSSAALCVCITKIILGRNPQLQHSASRVWDIAHRLEIFFHSKASGIDTAISSFDAPLLLSSKTSHEAPQSAHLVQSGSDYFQACVLDIDFLSHIEYAYTPREEINANIIPRIVARIESAVDTEYRAGNSALQSDNADAALLSRWTRAHTTAIDLIKHHSPTESTSVLFARLAPHIEEIQCCLVEMGLSTPQSEALLVSMKEKGAVAAKISGGGFGGACYGLFPTPR